MRVELRPLRRSDRDEFLRLAIASRKLHRPWVYLRGNDEWFDHYVSPKSNSLRFLICRKSDGGIAGVISISEIIRGPLQSAFIGFFAMHGSAGQGFMTEGLTLAVRYAFNRLKLHRLEANIQPGNARSKALAKRCGFKKEGFSPQYLKIGGRWRDHERWAITR